MVLILIVKVVVGIETTRWSGCCGCDRKCLALEIVLNLGAEAWILVYEDHGPSFCRLEAT